MSAIHKAVTREELSRHCHRRTRGAEVTLQLIKELLLQLSMATNYLGVPVLGVQMVTIWEEQKKHLKCIQDPSGVPLYTITGHITKGGVELPVFQCARGTTSLESFHLYLARYVCTYLHSQVNNFLLDLSRAFQQVMSIIKDFCWKVCPGGTRQEHSQLHSSKIAN